MNSTRAPDRAHPSRSISWWYVAMHATDRKQELNSSQGIAGLTERDIKLVQEGGFHTVESIAYTYANTPPSLSWLLTLHIAQSACWSRSRVFRKRRLANC